jgi:LmbE family N-acetylglucosaminyl deacetylase
VRCLLNGLLSKLAPDTVLTPLGAGGHVDHLAVADSILGLFADEAVQGGAPRVLFFEDLPYVAKEPAALEERLGSLRRDGWTLHPHVVDVSKVFERKMEDIAIYRTQRPARWEEAIRAYASSIHGAGGAAERLWELVVGQ